MNNDDTFSKAFLSILIENVNASGTCIPEDICTEIAHYINMLPADARYGSPLCDFIWEYGEDVDETYMGRDNDGEKIYHTFNPETNWHERIKKELVKLGYYKRNPPVYIAA